MGQIQRGPLCLVISPKPASTGSFRANKPAVLSRLGPPLGTGITSPMAAQWMDAGTSMFAPKETVKGITQPQGAPPSTSHLKQIITPL